MKCYHKITDMAGINKEMESVIVDISQHCPVLIKKEDMDLTVQIYPATENDTWSAPCTEGGRLVDATIVDDAYFRNKMVEIELKCEGCEALKKGFTKVIRRLPVKRN